MNDRLIGFLQIGQVFRTKPTRRQFETVVALAEQWGVDADRATLKQAFFSGKVVTAKEHDSAIKLLAIFRRTRGIEQPGFHPARKCRTAGHRLGAGLYQGTPARETFTRPGRQVREHEHLLLRKVFRKVAGITYTNYLARVRIEKSKNLLLNPNLRISEIAYEVGFQSLTHFNRIFKRILRQSPTEYREQLTTG